MDTVLDGQSNYQGSGVPDFNELKVNNRIDVYDQAKAKWREARVIQITYADQLSASIKTIRVHFKGLHSKFDEDIMVQDFPEKISPI